MGNMLETRRTERKWSEWRRAVMTFATAVALYAGTVLGMAIADDWNAALLIYSPIVFGLGALTMRVWIMDEPAAPVRGEVRCMCGWSQEVAPDQALAAVRRHVEFDNCPGLDL